MRFAEQMFDIDREVFDIDSEILFIQQLFAGMGVTDSADKWQDQYQIIEKSSHNTIIKARHKVHHDRFDIISTHVIDSSDKQQLFSRINKRETLKSPFIVPLLRACHNQQEFVCNSTEKYDLVFIESSPTLLDILKFRQAKRESFNNEEIMHVIKHIAAGLKNFRSFEEQYGCVTLNNIVIKGRVMLKDNFIVREEQRDYLQYRSSKNIKGYPSPQKINACFDQLTGFDQFPADLFSLGVVALQLVYPLMSMKQIYINKNPHYENNKVNFELVNSLVLGISSALLKQAIAILLSFEPNQRLDIYRICETFPKETSKVRMLKQNPWSGKKEDELIEPISPYDVTPLPNPINILKSERTGNATTNYNSHANSIVSKITSSPQYQTYQSPVPFKSTTNGTETITGRNYQNIKFANRPITHNSIINAHPNFTTHNQVQQPSFPVFKGKLALNNQKPLPTTINISNIQLNKATDNYRGKHYQQIKSNIASHRVQSNIFPSFSSFVNPSLENKNIITSMPLKNHTETNDIPFSHTYDFTKIQRNNNDNEIYFSFEKYKAPISQQSNHLRNLEELIYTHNPITSIAQTKSQTQKSQNQNKAPEYVEEEYQIGTRYQGSKINGKRNGQGKFYYKEGSHYDGEWKDNRMDGEGVLYYPDGNIAYNGQWKNDQFHGKGIIYNDKPIPIPNAFDYTNFSPLEDEWLCYEGDLKHDAKWGVGKLVLTNGEYYQGQFQNDIVNGEGTFTRMNGNKVHGIWSNSCLRKIIS